MLMKLEPYTDEFEVRHPFICSENLLPALRTGGDIETGAVEMLMPYDRLRNAWLPSVEVPNDILPFKLLGFTGSRTFRMVSATFNDVGGSDCDACISVVTFMITDDFNSIVLAAPTQVAIIRKIMLVSEVHEVDGKLIVVSFETDVNTVVHEVCGTTANEVVRLPNRYVKRSCIINGRFVFTDYGDGDENWWQLFSYDFGTKQTIAVPGKKWGTGDACRFTPNGILLVVSRSNARITVYNLSSDLEHSPFYVVHPVIPDGIDEIYPMPSGHIGICSQNRDYEKVWVMWIDPPTLAELALAVIHGYLSEQAKRKLKNLDDPVVGYSRFVEILTT